MAKFKTIKDFSRLSDLQVLEKCDEVLFGLDGNADFPTPDPTLPALTIIRDEYADAITAAANGGLVLKAVKDEKRKALEAAMYKEATYVELNGKNTESIMRSSGFDVYSTARGTAPASGKPKVKSVVDGTISGETIVKCDRVEHAVVYELRYTEDEFSADARWTHLVAQTATTFYLTRLTPTKYIWIQIRTISTKGPSDWSDPYHFMVR